MVHRAKLVCCLLAVLQQASSIAPPAPSSSEPAPSSSEPAPASADRAAGGAPDPSPAPSKDTSPYRLHCREFLKKTKLENHPEVLHSALLYAAEKNCVGVVEDLTQEGSSETAAAVLKTAAASGAVDVLKLLMNYAEVGVETKSEALFDAVENGQERMAALLLKNGADIDAQKELTGTTPLMSAVRIGNVNLIKLLVDSGADVSIAKQRDNKQGVRVSAVWLALETDQRDIVMLLLKQSGPEAKKQALLDAALRNAENTFSSLLAAGVDVDFANERGSTALLFAAKAGNLHIVKEALAYRANANIAMHNGITPLMMASRAGDNAADIMYLLLEAGAAVDQQAENKMTALIFAASSGNADAVATLLARGADPNLRNDDGQSAFSFAQSEAIVSMLPHEESALEMYAVPVGVAVFVLALYLYLSSSSEKKQRWCKETLTEIYTKYNKSKLSEVDALVKKFYGNEDKLIRVARQKYCGEETKKTK